MGTENPTATASLRCRLADQQGLTLIELLVTIMVLAIGLLGLASAFDSSRRLATVAEMHDTAAALAEGEIARVEAAPWAEIALAANPTFTQGSLTTDPTHYYYSAECPGGPIPSTPAYHCYQWDWEKPSSVEPLVVSAGGDSTLNPQTWKEAVPTSEGAVWLEGKIYRFITWANDPKCLASACGGSGDYKRITVAVTVDQKTSNRQIAPVVLSTLYANPAGKEVDPLTQAGVKCNDKGVSVECDH